MVSGTLECSSAVMTVICSVWCAACNGFMVLFGVQLVMDLWITVIFSSVSQVVYYNLSRELITRNL